MNYKEAVFIFRDGKDDFTLWAVDLPESTIQCIKNGASTNGSSIRELLGQMPIQNSDNHYTLLETAGNTPVLFTRDMGYDFFEANCHRGYSVRGCLSSILGELTEESETMGMNFN